jgi:DNA-binding NarL/FixJ family response regulator
MEILTDLAAGISNKEIARKRGIGLETVKRHVSNIFEKLEVASRTEAARIGWEHGLVQVTTAPASTGTSLLI